MKHLAPLFLAGMLLCSSGTFAQNAHEAQVKVSSNMQNAIVADYASSDDLVSTALFQKLEQAGLTKKSSSNGYKVFKGVIWQDISPDKLDVYVKVTGNSKKATVTLLLSHGYDNFVSSAKELEIVQRVIGFLNGLNTGISTVQLQQQVAVQQTAVKKAQDALSSAQQDGKDLEKERDRLNKKIDENREEQAKKQKALDDENRKLDALKAQPISN